MIDKKSDLDKLSNLLKVIAEPNRLQILMLLMQGAQCNCEIGNNLNIAPNLISHHLGILKKAGLVEFSRHATDGRWIYYSINRQNLAWLQDQLEIFLATSISEELNACCEPQVVIDSNSQNMEARQTS